MDDAQLGDYFQNGGYGSILISYMPGALGYTREEDTLLSLSAAFDGGRLELMTMAALYAGGQHAFRPDADPVRSG